MVLYIYMCKDAKFKTNRRLATTRAMGKEIFLIFLDSDSRAPRATSNQTKDDEF